VDHVLGVEVVGVGDGDLAELDRALRDRLLVDRPVGATAQRARDAAAHLEARPGGVHQRVRHRLGDVPLDGVKLHGGASTGAQ